MSTRCGCTEEEYSLDGLFSISNILQCQRASDFLISLAYFSIPLELCYFVSCSSIFPFSWIFLQFGAFIVLCGLTHFVNVWTYSPHSFQLMLALTVLKFLTALVSCATSITLLTLLPQMLRVMVREGLLRKKTWELRHEVGMMKRQEEARWHVRMLTREIRRSLDRHTILYTTLVELSKVLFLENCAVWMPDEGRRVLNLTHELKPIDDGDRSAEISVDDLDVAEVIERKGAGVLGPESRLRRVFGSGVAAAVRVPILKVANFKGGTPQVIDAPYAVLVLVLPAGRGRDWAPQELEIVEAVADQVAVALSHAAVLEDSMAMREKLMEQNMAFQQARQDALLANEARNAFKKVMSREMMAPARSMAAVLSCLRHEDLRPDQWAVVDVLMKSSLLLSTYMEEAAEASNSENSRWVPESRPFSLHAMMRDVVRLLKLVCSFKGLNFDLSVSKDVPDHVVGDEKRVLQAVMYMMGNVALYGEYPSNFVIRVCVEGRSDPNLLAWKRSMGDHFVCLRFEASRISSAEDLSSFLPWKDRECSGSAPGFHMCKKLAELMHGTVSTSSTPDGRHRSICMTIRLQCIQSSSSIMQPMHPDPGTSVCLFKGMNILLADSDRVNQYIARKVLEKLGCNLFIVSSWYQCLETLNSINSNVTEFHLLLIDLSMLEEGGHEMSGRVRRIRSGSWRLIIGLAFKVDQETRVRCHQNGIHGALSKPIILHEMEDELRRIIQPEGPVRSPDSSL